MLTWFLRRQLEQFEARYSYDLSYAREILRVSPKALMLYFKATQLGRFRKQVPADVFAVVQLVVLMHEDCGACVQLGIDMALEAGVSSKTLLAVVAGDDRTLSADCRLAVCFARAVLTRGPEADELRDRLRERYTSLGLVSLAFGMTAARIYPTVKYALGYGKACTRLKVAGQDLSATGALAKVGEYPA